MLFSGSEQMQVVGRVVQFVAIDMVDDFTRLRPGNLPMLPLPALTLSLVPEAVGRVFESVRKAVPPLRLWPRRNGLPVAGNRRDHLVSATAMGAVLPAICFALVGIKRVAVFARHLIVAIAHFPRDCWAVTVGAWATDFFAAPFVICRTVSLHPLVVHEANTVRCVFPTAAVDRALSHVPRLKFCGKPVNCADWLAERIRHVEAILKSEAA